MALSTQFSDRVGATPGTSLARQYLGALVVADSCVKSGSLTSFSGAVLTFGAMVVVINAADGTPAQEVQKSGGTYTITGGTNTDNYVFLSTAGAYSQTAVTRGSAPPSVPSGTICILFASIAGTAGTIVSTTNVAPTIAQLLASSISAHAPAGIPGFAWTAAKSVGDQLAALGTAVTALSSGTGGEIAGADFKATGLTGATAGARFVGGVASGHPTSGTFAKGDLAVDQTGLLWLCTGAGTPGTWAAIGDQPGMELLAADFNVAGLSGATSGTRLVGATSSGAPASGTFQTGDVVVARSGVLWLCTASGTPGTWQAFDARNQYTGLPSVSGVASGWSYNAGASVVKTLSGVLNFTAAGTLAAGGTVQVCTVSLAALSLSATPSVQITMFTNGVWPLVLQLNALSSSFFVPMLTNASGATFNFGVSTNNQFSLCYAITP